MTPISPTKKEKTKNEIAADIKRYIDKYFDENHETLIASLSGVAEKMKFLGSFSLTIKSETNTDNVTLKPGDCGEYNYDIDKIDGDEALETDTLAGPRKRVCIGTPIKCYYPHKTETVSWYGKVWETKVSFETTRTEEKNKVTIRVYQKVTYVMDVHHITFQYIRCCCKFFFDLLHLWGQCWVEYKIVARDVAKQENSDQKLISETVYRNLGQEAVDAIEKAILDALGSAAGKLTEKQLNKLIQELQKKYGKKP